MSVVLLPFLVASALAGGIIAHVVQPLPQYNLEQNTATGEYGYSYSDGPSAKTEFRALDGTTTGAYSYIDAHGLLQTVNYVADEFGFRAAGTNIPSAAPALPLDLPEVAAAKAAHLAEHSRATLAALSHQRRKRGILATPITLAQATVVPLSSSSQSRVQIHKSAHLVAHHPVAVVPTHTYLLRKKRGLAYLAAPLIEHLPVATSRQNRFQIHKSAKLVQEYHLPVYAAPVPIAAPVAPLIEHLPVATSRQNHFQIHKGAKLIQEYHHQPIYAVAPAYLPAAPAKEYLPSAPAATPIVEASVADEAVKVESA
ncbi:uncharacterized protein LOC106645595 [Copidosoma floridanum]|uniref:uncharacterized protein LOC106645595 n=1 Tax=Copidosoma floridanum TaxID=29053 RepID=UPI0006C9C25E|nr:uncharacterized protein LOC106645595 [Copidosoma floridanum]